MEYEEMSIDQLNAISDDLDAQGRELATRRKFLSRVRNRKLEEDHADQWGLTPEEYKEVKAQNPAKEGEENVSLTSALNTARKRKSKEARNAQTATVVPVAVKGEAKQRGDK